MIACDGLWDKLSYEDAISLACMERANGHSPQEVANALCQESLQRGSLDNVTVIVLFLASP